MTSQTERSDRSLDVEEDCTTVYLLLRVERARQTKLVPADLVVPHLAAGLLLTSDETTRLVTAVLVADLIGGTTLVADEVEDGSTVSPRGVRVVRGQDVHAVTLL